MKKNNRTFRTIRIALLLLVMLGAMASLPACNTVEGVGQDVSAAGQTLADSAAKHNPSR